MSRVNRWQVGYCALVALGAESGCSTSYVPKTPGRVAMVMEGGSPAFMRDGRLYHSGLFGGELEEAVRGNPEAERHARAYSSGMTSGFVSLLLGGVGMLGGAVAVGDASARPGNHSAEGAIGATALVGGFAAYITGLVLMLDAEPHLFDAINVFNDGAAAATPPPYGTYPPPPPQFALPPPQVGPPPLPSTNAPPSPSGPATPPPPPLTAFPPAGPPASAPAP